MFYLNKDKVILKSKSNTQKSRTIKKKYNN